MKDKTSKFTYWTPRILSILFLLFLTLFSLDIFEGNYGFWGTVLGLFMHNIPVIILAAIVWASWRREWIGGVAFILAGLAYITMLLVSIVRNEPHEWYSLFWTLPISGPAFLIGALWLANWSKKKKRPAKS